MKMIDWALTIAVGFPVAAISVLWQYVTTGWRLGRYAFDNWLDDDE